MQEKLANVNGNKKPRSGTPADETQVGGDHYRQGGVQHWTFAWDNGLDYFQGQVTKYVTRWKLKNGIEDLHKARHFLQKYIELVEADQAAKKEIEGAPDTAEEPAARAEETEDTVIHVTETLRLCRNCRHVDISGAMKPCVNCDSHFSNWEPPLPAEEPGRGYVSQD